MKENMNTREVTLEELQQAVDQLVAKGRLEIVKHCLVSVPESWKDLLPSSEFGPVKPLYQIAKPPVPDSGTTPTDKI